MRELLNEVKEFRQKLYQLEILLEIEGGRRSRDWFAGKAPEEPERAEAVDRLVKTGLIEPASAPEHFRLTQQGAHLLTNVRARIAAEGRIDWTRVNELDFRKL